MNDPRPAEATLSEAALLTGGVMVRERPYEAPADNLALGQVVDCGGSGGCTACTSQA
jgi:hypothetical protein